MDDNVDYHLVVREPFAGFQRGDDIHASDPRAAAILADPHWSTFVVKHLPQPRAPEAPVQGEGG